MRFVGPLLVGPFALCWLQGGFAPIATRDNWPLGEMALGVLLLIVGRLVLGRAYARTTDYGWKARFGAGIAMTAAGSAGLARFAASAVRYESGRNIMMTIFGAGALVIAIVAAISFRATSAPKVPDNT
ncbi:MAG: hypothetical protein JSR34_11145 [Proteobacteria bacterium]|nr:hypothetical protein [Pseudomonadota bacterium]